jgi:hypothetical protein
MEDPATWGPAERVVQEALLEAQRASDEVRFGLSTARTVTNALRKARLLLDRDTVTVRSDQSDTPVKVIHWPPDRTGVEYWNMTPQERWDYDNQFEGHPGFGQDPSRPRGE